MFHVIDRSESRAATNCDLREVVIQLVGVQGTGHNLTPYISCSRQCEALGSWPIFVFNHVYPQYLLLGPNYLTLAFCRFPSFIRQR